MVPGYRLKEEDEVHVTLSDDLDPAGTVASVKYLTSVLEEVDAHTRDEYSVTLQVTFADGSGKPRPDLVEQDLFDRAVGHSQGRDMVRKYVETLTRLNRWRPFWADEENQAGAKAIAALVGVDESAIVTCIDYLRSNDMDHEVNQNTLIERIFDQYGWCDSTLSLLAARAISAAGQHGREQIEVLLERGPLRAHLAQPAEAQKFLTLLIAELGHHPGYLSSCRGLTPCDGAFDRFERLVDATVEYWGNVLDVCTDIFGADSPYLQQVTDLRDKQRGQLLEAGRRAADVFAHLQTLRDDPDSLIAAAKECVGACRPLASALYSQWASVLGVHDRWSEVLEVSAVALEETPIDCRLLHDIIVAHLRSQNFSEVIDLWRRVKHRVESLADGQVMADTIANILEAYGRCDRFPEARHDLDREITFHEGRGNPVLLANVACMHAKLGDADKAVHYIQRALEAGADHSLLDDSDFDGIREEPVFGAIVV